jgi:penicillin-binding protein 1C
VWLGNLDNSGSDRLVGAEAAAPLALQIIATVDAGGEESFAPPPGFTAAVSASAELSPASADRLVMLSPTPGQEILHDPAIPANRQQLALQARIGDGRGSVYWFIDGNCLGDSPTGEPLWWSPTPGAHQVRAVSESGDSATTDIHVR